MHDDNEYPHWKSHGSPYGKEVNDEGGNQAEAVQPASKPRMRTEYLLTAVHQRLMTVLDHQSSRTSDPLATLENIFYSHLRFLTKNPLIPLLVKRLIRSNVMGVRNQVKGIIRQYESDILLILRKAKSKGLLHAGVDTRAAAGLFVSMLQGMVLRMHITGDAVAVYSDAKSMIRGYINALRSDIQGGSL